jgi:hypothetical protein
LAAANDNNLNTACNQIDAFINAVIARSGNQLAVDQANQLSITSILVLCHKVAWKRPSDIPPGGSFNDTFFNGSKSPFNGSSLPSGQAAGLFFVAPLREAEPAFVDNRES